MRMWRKDVFSFDNKRKYVAPLFIFLTLVLSIVGFILFREANVRAVYTRNNLSWTNTEVFEDGSVKLSLKNKRATVTLKSDVEGDIGYYLYLYTEKETSSEVCLSEKDVTEIEKSEYPDFLEGYDVKSAYLGYLDGGEEKKFTVLSDGDTELLLLMIIEDNNSYPKEEKDTSTVANVKLFAEVLLDGQYARGKDYSFSLKNEKGEVIETVKNDDGYISFSNISFKKKGTYEYYLSQNEGKDEKTSYDKSIYKIKVVVEENGAFVFYEKDGEEKETLPRFSNYKEKKYLANMGNSQYPTNEKKSNESTNFLPVLFPVAFLLLLFYTAIRKKGVKKNEKK